MKTYRLIIVTSLAFLLLIILYYTGIIGSSERRLATEQSISPPESTAHICCGGFFSIPTFGDFDASASFEIARSDLPSLLAQFVWDTDVKDEEPRGLEELMVVPPQFGNPTLFYRGWSSGRNRVYLQTYDIDTTVVGVCIYTIWN